MVKDKLLLIDVGNTLVKCQLATRKQLYGRRKSFQTTQLTKEEFISSLSNWDYEIVVICSVVPAMTKLIAQTVSKPVYVLNPSLKHSPTQLSGIDLSLYPQSATLGADRLAAMVGAWNLYGPHRPMLVISLGTAVTLNVVDIEGRFLGGTIAPGFSAFANAVQPHTALLPTLGSREQNYSHYTTSIIAKSTQQALVAAASYGWRGVIKELIYSTQTEFKQKYLKTSKTKKNQTKKFPLQVIATGGVAAQLAKDLPELKHVDPNLTLEGLRCLAYSGGISSYST